MEEWAQKYAERWIKEPNALIVKEMREESGLGMMECKHYLTKAKMLHDLDQANSVEQLRDLMKTLVNANMWKLR